MFFSFDILVKKNGRFALVWQYIHDKKKISKARERELLAIDVSESCTELRNYMPSGRYSNAETKQKMSLYLLSQLFYGIVLLHNLQTTVYLDNLQAFTKTLLRVSSESKAKRKRPAAIVGEEDDAESTASKRRRTPRPEVPTMMDLTQPKSYMREHTPIPHLVDPLLGEGLEDDNFETKESSHGTLLDWDMEDVGIRRINRKVSIATVFGGEGSEKRQPRVSISDMDYLASPEALRRPTGQFDVSHLSMVEQVVQSRAPSPMQELLDLQELSQRSAHRDFSGGITRQSVDEDQEEEDEDFILEPLPKKTPTRRNKPTKRAHDQRTVMSEAEIAKRMENVDRLVRPKERVLFDMKRLQRDGYFARLTNPVPSHLMEIRFPGLNPVFETVLHKVKELPLTFRMASKVDYDEMRRHRRLAFEIVSWNSEGGGVQDAYTPGMPMSQSKNGRMVHGRSLTPSVIVPDSAKSHVPAPSFSYDETPIAPKPSSIADQHRMSSLSVARRASTPIVPGEESRIAYNEFRGDEILDDMGVVNYPAVVYQHQEEEGDELGPAAQRLLQLIDGALEEAGDLGVIQFSDVVMPTRAERARDFYALLSLLKHREIKVKQPECWGSIYIKRQSQQPKEEQEESSKIVGDVQDEPDTMED